MAKDALGNADGEPGISKGESAMPEQPDRVRGGKSSRSPSLHCGVTCLPGQGTARASSAGSRCTELREEHVYLWLFTLDSDLQNQILLCHDVKKEAKRLQLTD